MNCFLCGHEMDHENERKLVDSSTTTKQPIFKFLGNG